MSSAFSRRSFLGLLPAAALAPRLSRAQEKSAIYPEFPRHDPKLVLEVVGASHGNLERVSALVKRYPTLAKAAWDWGFGDWETAIGAASHVGRLDIVQQLISAGARPDIFTFVMMGNLAAVKAMIAVQPGVQKVPGPHGITMLAHARNSGERAKEVYDYLISLGDADPVPLDRPISPAERQTYMGKYTFGVGGEDFLVVGEHRLGMLTISRGSQSARNLIRAEEHSFAPVGAPEVRVRFRMEGGRAVGLTIHDPEPILTAVR